MSVTDILEHFSTWLLASIPARVNTYWTVLTISPCHHFFSYSVVMTAAMRCVFYACVGWNVKWEQYALPTIERFKLMFLSSLKRSSKTDKFVIMLFMFPQTYSIKTWTMSLGMQYIYLQHNGERLHTLKWFIACTTLGMCLSSTLRLDMAQGACSGDSLH